MGRKRAQPSKHFRKERSSFRVNEIRSACTASITGPIYSTPIEFEYYAVYMLYNCWENGEVSASIILYIYIWMYFTHTQTWFTLKSHTYTCIHIVCGVYSNRKTLHLRFVVLTLSHLLYNVSNISIHNIKYKGCSVFGNLAIYYITTILSQIIYEIVSLEKFARVIH